MELHKIDTVLENRQVNKEMNGMWCYEKQSNIGERRDCL